ncbi:calcyphosin-2 isoform X1 [Brachionus plicatilis]|uniref:Calcyphosin-2 isoform X1 n=1 Tax=Brachionus plicatilis TaxID=10195 RepID=A0A3M7QEA7_BRAPC|nr:calcyphosin-2 isoform X1 [Brachionus plicatilis]
MSTKIVRNPITGEEIVYKKGPKPNEQIKIPELSHDQRVKTLLNSQFMTYEKQHEPEANLSLQANASSIPILNFGELESDESRSKHNNLRHQNPIIAPDLIEKSARPKSAYAHALNTKQDQSPILLYHQKITEQTPPVSHLNAPRVQPQFEKQLEIVPGPAVQKKSCIYRIERVADLEKLWLENGAQTPKPADESKQIKEKLIVDTVVTDQLSKFVIANHKTMYTPRGNKYTVIDNHARPTSSLSENVLAKKLKFNCRIRSPNGRLALRDLFGIIFLHDGSLTIYEFRLLCGAYITGVGSGNVSKKANALPFLSRKVHVQKYGRRRGKPVDLYDIYKGAVLYLPCGLTETSLPDTVRQNEYLEVEVTEVNELEKENLLVGQILAGGEMSQEMNRKICDVKERVKRPLSDLETNDVKIINSVRKFLLKQIEDRSVEVYMGLGKTLKNKSLKNDMKTWGFVNQQDLHDAFVEYNIQIHSEDLSIVWQSVDSDGLGYLSYYNLLRVYLGEMNTQRHGFFRQLMHKLDTQKVGYVQISDVYKFYKAGRHPKVKSGLIKEDDMFEKFLSVFDLLPLNKVPDYFELSLSTDFKSPLISYEQMEEYYNGLSIVIESDKDFISILKNSWNQ